MKFPRWTPQGVTRRGFLKGVGGVSLALPLMTSLGCNTSSPTQRKLGSAALAAGFPKRLVVIYIPNGGLDLPASMDFTGTMLEPLAPFAPKINVLSGLDLSVHDKPPGEPHQQGMAFLTGRSLNAGNQVGGDGSLAGWASGISVDQEIANAIGTDTPQKSLHFGVQSTAYGGTEVRTVISYAGSDQPIANEVDPFNMFNVVFSQLGADPAGVATLRARRHSVLDAVGGQFDKLNPRLSTEDKKKLDQHLTAVREVESRLDNPGGTIGGYCQKPELGAAFDLNSPSNYPIIGQLQMDLLSMALACDLTRVVTLQWSASTNNKPYPFLGIDGDEHVMGHQPDSDTATWDKLRIIKKWYMEQFAYLLGKLDSMEEGEGTMLDNTVVLFTSEIARGNSHSHTDSPWLMAGSGGGYFQTGKRLQFDLQPHNNLLVSLLNGMGIDASTFGDPEFCTGPLAGLTV
ncbi:MAG: DUF1552 domain-containing protein [Polyangiaceae bacterium]